MGVRSHRFHKPVGCRELASAVGIFLFGIKLGFFLKVMLDEVVSPLLALRRKYTRHSVDHISWSLLLARQWLCQSRHSQRKFRSLQQKCQLIVTRTSDIY